MIVLFIVYCPGLRIYVFNHDYCLCPQMATEAAKKKKTYVLPRMDIALIIETLQHNPYKNGNAVYCAIMEHLRQT